MNNQNGTPNIAFIGCGNIAHIHMRYLKKVQLSVVSVCDASKIRVDAFADQYDIIKRYTDVDILLANEKPNVVHILTPPHTHHALIVKALRAGSHVLVEKPICESYTELQEILQMASDRSLLVSVDHTQVYKPMIVQARNKFHSGDLGKIIRMEFAYDNPSLIKSTSNKEDYRLAKGTPAWFAKVKGGILTDLLPHPLSVLLSFDPELVLSHVNARTIRGGIIEELTVMLRSEKVDAIINLSLNQRPLKNNLNIFAERGSIRIDLRNMFSVFLPERKLPGIISRIVVTLSESWQIMCGFTINVIKLLLGKAHTYDGLDEIIKNFYEFVAAGKCGYLPLVNADRVTELIDEITEIALVQKIENNDSKVIQSNADRIDKPAECLVTGGTGFIGRIITEYLVDNGKKTRVFCRPTSNTARLPQECGVAFGDLRNLTTISDALTGIKSVVHCAAAVSGDWAEYYESTVMGTQNVLTSLENSSVERLVYISSLGILDYNKLKNGSNVDETSPVESKPTDRGFYTRSKVEAEEMVLRFAERNPKVKVVILRPGLVYGHETNNNLQNCGILLDRFLFVFGLGKRTLGLNYVDNLAQAVVSATHADLPSGSVIQIVDPEQPSVSEIIREHNKLSGNKVVPIYIPVALWKSLFLFVDALLLLKNKKFGTFGYRFASNSKILNYNSKFAKEVLEQFPKFGFSESFARTYDNKG